MVFGRYVNKYYIKHFWALLLGVIALVAVDFFQLEIPEFYNYIVSGLGSEDGMIKVDGVCLHLYMRSNDIYYSRYRCGKIFVENLYVRYCYKGGDRPARKNV